MAELEIKKLKSIVVRVKITKEFEIRRFIAIKLLSLAIVVLGGRTIFTKENDNKEEHF